MADYLKQVSGIWYFQRAVPTEFQSAIGKKLWSTSLRTDSRREAERLIHAHIAKTDETIRRAALLRDQEKLIASLPSAQRAELSEGGGVTGILSEIARDEMALNFLRASFPVTDVTSDDREQRRLDEIDDAETIARMAYMNQENARKRALLAKLGAIEVPDDQPKTGLHQLLDDYAKAASLPISTVNQYRYAVRRFTELCGDLEITAVTKAHLRSFIAALPGLPKNHKSVADGLTFNDAVVAARDGGLPTLGPRTVARHAGTIVTLTRHAAANGFVESDPLFGYRIRQPKAAPRDPRLPFDFDDLRAICSCLKSEYPVSSDDRWIPLLALFHGARLEELCQLEAQDVVFGEGVRTPYIDINDDGAGKKVKNKASRRQVPIHPVLIQVGFLDFVRAASTAGNGFVFSTLRPDRRDRRGGQYGKRFGRFLRDKVKITDPRKVFHSFRHTWTDAARNAGVPDDVRRQLAGRENTGSEAQYGSGHSLESCVRWLAKVRPIPAKYL